MKIGDEEVMEDLRMMTQESKERRRKWKEEKESIKVKLKEKPESRQDLVLPTDPQLDPEKKDLIHNLTRDPQLDPEGKTHKNTAGIEISGQSDGRDPRQEGGGGSDVSLPSKKVLNLVDEVPGQLPSLGQEDNQGGDLDHDDIEEMMGIMKNERELCRTCAHYPCLCDLKCLEERIRNLKEKEKEESGRSGEEKEEVIFKNEEGSGQDESVEDGAQRNQGEFLVAPPPIDPEPQEEEKEAEVTQLEIKKKIGVKKEEKESGKPKGKIKLKNNTPIRKKKGEKKEKDDRKNQAKKSWIEDWIRKEGEKRTDKEEKQENVIDDDEVFLKEDIVTVKKVDIVVETVKDRNFLKDKKISQGTGFMDKLRKFSQVKEDQNNFEEWKKARQVSNQLKRKAEQVDREDDQSSTAEGNAKKKQNGGKQEKRKAEQVYSKEEQNSTATENVKKTPSRQVLKRKAKQVHSEAGQNSTAMEKAKKEPSRTGSTGSKQLKKKEEQVYTKEKQNSTAMKNVKNHPSIAGSNVRDTGVLKNNSLLKYFSSYSTVGAEGAGVLGEGVNLDNGGRADMRIGILGMKQRAGAGPRLLFSPVGGSDSCNDGKTGSGGRINSTK